MAGEYHPRQHFGEAFWRSHHEAWKRSDLNQQQYPAIDLQLLKRMADEQTPSFAAA
jgi:hypothetical protein